MSERPGPPEEQLTQSSSGADEKRVEAAETEEQRFYEEQGLRLVKLVAAEVRAAVGTGELREELGISHELEQQLTEVENPLEVVPGIRLSLHRKWLRDDLWVEITAPGGDFRHPSITFGQYFYRTGGEQRVTMDNFGATSGVQNVHPSYTLEFCRQVASSIDQTFQHHEVDRRLKLLGSKPAEFGSQLATAIEQMQAVSKLSPWRENIGGGVSAIRPEGFERYVKSVRNRSGKGVAEIPVTRLVFYPKLSEIAGFLNAGQISGLRLLSDGVVDFIFDNTPELVSLRYSPRPTTSQTRDLKRIANREYWGDIVLSHKLGGRFRKRRTEVIPARQDDLQFIATLIALHEENLTS